MRFFTTLLALGSLLAGSLGAGAAAAAGYSTQWLILATSVAVALGSLWALYLLPDALLRFVLLLSRNGTEKFWGDAVWSVGCTVGEMRLIGQTLAVQNAFFWCCHTDV